MTFIDNSSGAITLFFDNKILTVDYRAAAVDVMEKQKVTMRFKPPALCIETQSLTRTLMLPVQILKNPKGNSVEFILPFDCEKLQRIFTQTSEMILDAECLKISNCLYKDFPVLLKHAGGVRDYTFNYAEACEKKPIENFVVKNGLENLLKHFVATKDLEVIQAFYELINEGKGVVREN